MSPLSKPAVIAQKRKRKRTYGSRSYVPFVVSASVMESGGEVLCWKFTRGPTVNAVFTQSMSSILL